MRVVQILPVPQQMTELAGFVTADYRTVIVLDPSCTDRCFLYAKMLQESIVRWCGCEASILKGKACKGDWVLRIEPQNKMVCGAYHLKADEEGVCISGADETGVLYGVQTLRQILSQSGSVFSAVEIEDAPALGARGFYHDVTRGRVPKLAELKKLADAMSFYKLNQLQLYVEHTYLFRDFPELWRDQTPLTAEEILEFDQYCADRGIDLVPSLSAFGHLYQLLRTKTAKQYCELEDKEPSFSFVDRMAHHTIAVSDPSGVAMIRGMVSEYMALFRSSYFNICCDETFDLCKGKSASLLEKKDLHTIYTEYVNELAQFVKDRGKTPMFWGDILCGHPEKLHDLPEGIICLNWGYAATQGDTETRRIAQTGARQYVCPGVGGWNLWINSFGSAYENIRRMCSYAHAYGAEGVLNTDWGDFGHINQPEFSRPGMIYGASFSWNTEILSFEEINRKISLLEFGDASGRIMEVLSKIQSAEVLDWFDIIIVYEMNVLGRTDKMKELRFAGRDPQETEEKTRRLCTLRRELMEAFSGADSRCRALLQKYLIALDGMILSARLRPFFDVYILNRDARLSDAVALAEDYERWFMHYKAEWRKTGKEGDIARIGEVIFWIADFLRDHAGN